MRALIVVLSLTLTPAVAMAQTIDAPAQTDVAKPAQVKQVKVLLSAIHGLPTRAQLEQAADDPYVVLRSLAKGSGPIADRALEAMFLFPDQQTLGGAVALLTAEAGTPRVHTLLMATAKAYGATATSVIATYLDNDEVRVRVTAAAALAEIRTDAAFAALDAAIATEENASAKKVMQRYARR